MKIAVFGPVSAGKSSLINKLLGLPLAEVKPTPTTKCICTFVRGNHTEKEAVSILADAKTTIELYNKFPSKSQYKPVKISGIVDEKANPWLIKNNVTLVDLPGFNDSVAVKSAGLMPNFLKEPLFKQLCEEVEKSDAVIFLLPPNLVNDEETLGKIVLMGSKNTNILVVLSRADEYRKANGEFDEALILTTLNQTEERTGLPVVALSVQADHNLTSIDNTLDIIENLAARKPTRHRQKEQLLHQMKERRFVPLKLLQHITDEEKKKTSTNYKKAAVGTAAAGGIAVGVAGALIAGGALLMAIPGIGTGAGAIAITSGLAALGGTMMGGIAAVAGITASAGLVGALVGSAAAAGITMGAGAIHTKVCLGSRMAKLIINATDESIPTLHVTAEQLGGLREACQESCKQRYFSLKPAMYPQYYSEEYLYLDSVIVELKADTTELTQGFYLVTGLFEKSKLVALQACWKVEEGTEAELQKQKARIESAKAKSLEEPPAPSPLEHQRELQNEENKKIIQQMLAEDNCAASTTTAQMPSKQPTKPTQQMKPAPTIVHEISEPFNLRQWLVDVLGSVPDIDDVCTAFEELEFDVDEAIAEMNESDVNSMATEKGWKRGRVVKLQLAIKKLRAKLGME